MAFFPQIVWKHSFLNFNSIWWFSFCYLNKVFLCTFWIFHVKMNMICAYSFTCLNFWGVWFHRHKNFMSLQTRIMFWVSHFLDTKRPFCYRFHFAIGLKINWLYLKEQLFPFEDKFFFKCWIKSSWSYFWHKLRHIFYHRAF